jgi:hypothetical protein
MLFFQKEIRLPAYARGFHLITGIVQREFTELSRYKPACYMSL